METEGSANAFRVETAGTIPYRTTHAGIMDADLNVETESTAAMLETPYTSENLQAGTWPKNTTKAALGEADIMVETEQQSARYKVERLALSRTGRRQPVSTIRM